MSGSVHGAHELTVDGGHVRSRTLPGVKVRKSRQASWGRQGGKTDSSLGPGALARPRYATLPVETTMMRKTPSPPSHPGLEVRLDRATSTQPTYEHFSL
ncbi:hypothetical protein AAFF_G00120910 [Aldrovandia affinis]|uniref:Uncharacterized protein n=1 Tax=Aldrovandia affinis TaxID=143900 RepID=A0AAD7WAD4_9TELE|nr:hypothetical protein AAFF_G00120910 [Aldrovandia affinis]